jgi:hypothetical protein
VTYSLKRVQWDDRNIFQAGRTAIPRVMLAVQDQFMPHKAKRKKAV